MELKSFWLSLEVPARTAFAHRCNTSFAHLRNVVYGKQPSPELAISIEMETDGAITAEQLRPDCAHLFAYLRGQRTTDAPLQEIRAARRSPVDRRDHERRHDERRHADRRK